jgi:hypothetical protein
MTGAEFEKALNRLGLSQRASGQSRFFGANERQIRRWVAGDSRVPESAAHLIRVMLEYKISVEDVEKLAQKK